jgi:hypothetical protein
LQERSSLPHRFWEAEWDKGCNNVGHVVELNPMHYLMKTCIRPLLCVGPEPSLINCPCAWHMMHHQ